mmetsp:Transcript_39426/g.92739  ORF Transcript_39426/g.92739 Transcript_39426/m.92739 type:complete len:287 (-) Transcript_39426:251-1111(-)
MSLLKASTSALAEEENVTCNSPSQISTATGSTSSSYRFGASPSLTDDDIDMLRSQATMIQWTVQIKRTPGRVGMQVIETMDGSAATVLHVRPRGQVATWNERNPSEAVRAGDIILQVNEVRVGARELMEAIMDEEPVLTMRLARYVQFPAIIDRHSKLGLGLVEDCLRLVDLEEGSASTSYNEAVPPELKLLPGDRIAVCNGRRLESDIRKQLAQAPRVELVLHRPVPGAAVHRKEKNMDAKASISKSGRAVAKSLVKAFKTSVGFKNKMSEPVDLIEDQPLLEEC